MIVLSRNSGYQEEKFQDEQRLKRLQSTLQIGLERKSSSLKLRDTPITKKTNAFFENMFSPFGSTQTANAATPRSSVANATHLCTYVLSEKKETIRRIIRTYQEAAELSVENTLTLDEKKSRIATYVGALSLILTSKVCHGDLKPENILWDDDHFVISDFNGSILIEDVCELMNPEFKIESDDYRGKLSTVVSAFIKKSAQLEKVCQNNLVQFKKLVRLGIVNEERQVLDEDKLKTLNSYLRTKFFPDHSKGYASELYLKKMGDYFWQGDKANFENAAQAFDIRAAGLTIYVILTGARPPLKEDDVTYYDTLERSLLDLGICPRATSLIRRMAEPVVKKFGKNFTMPVTMDELEELERIFAGKPVLYLAESPPPPKGELQATYENIQEAIERLSLIEGEESDTTTQNTMNNLIKALSADQISQRTAKLLPEDKLDIRTRKQIIERAFERFPNSCQISHTIDEQQHTILLLVDENNLHRCDVLLKKEVIGNGASAVACKALSLRSLQYVVVRDFQDFADPEEAEHAQLVLSQIGSHEGLQSAAQPFDVQIEDSIKKVVIDAYYKKRDYGAAVHGEILCRRLSLPQQQWGDAALVKEALNEVNKELMGSLLSRAPMEEKNSRLKSFIEDYGNSLIAILGISKGKQLLEDYNSLICESTPISVLPEPIKEEEEKKSPRKFGLFSFGLNSPKSPRSPRTAKQSPRLPHSRRNSIGNRSESFSWIDTDNIDLSTPPAPESNIEVINVKALEMLLKDPNMLPDYREEVKANARRITVKAIRDCQRLILQDYLIEHSDPTKDDNPAQKSRTWQKKAEVIEGHLDIKGINHISKLLGVEAVIETDNSSPRQKTLSQLLAIKEQVWLIAGA
ncbi:MAG: hypothetical protein JSR37_05575 [Verrucomicrobia bacterium]|nr:hypothetical protein [Verrucomicrobiota bacterium]